jgi:hypothetical protein
MPNSGTNNEAKANDETHASDEAQANNETWANDHAQVSDAGAQQQSQAVSLDPKKKTFENCSRDRGSNLLFRRPT